MPLTKEEIAHKTNIDLFGSTDRYKQDRAEGTGRDHREFIRSKKNYRENYDNIDFSYSRRKKK